jgi:hypothetical protein
MKYAQSGLMHDVARVRERAVPPDVIDVQMRVHDDVDLLGRELAEQARVAIGKERARLRAGARVDEDGSVATAKQDAVHRQPPIGVRVDRRERLAVRRERTLAINEHVRRHSGFRPAKPSSTPCQ